MYDESGRKSSAKVLWTAAICCLCVVFLGLALFSLRMPASVKGDLFGESQPSQPLEDGVLKEDDRSPEGMKLAAENDHLAMFFNAKTSEIAILDKDSDSWWYSGAAGASDEELGSAAKAANVKSIVRIRYYDANDALMGLNSYNDSVKSGSFEYELLKDGIRMNFVLEKGAVTREMLPAVVAKDKFEERVLSKLSEDEKELVETYYLLQKPSEITDSTLKKQYDKLYTALDEDAEYYFLDLYAPKFKIEGIYQAVCVTAGYTADDIREDNEAVGYDAEVSVFTFFRIPVEFTLEGDSMMASIAASQIETTQGCRIAELALMPYFGSSDVGQAGSLFVPDGSGALIHFNNGRTPTSAYSMRIYGLDQGIERLEASFTSANALFPAFGIIYDDTKSVLAVIEEGESHGTIQAGVTGKDDARNWVGSFYEINPMAEEIISDTRVNARKYLYQKEPYAGRISVRYLFGGEESADYSGLAALYRGYLKDSGIFSDGSAATRQFDLKLHAKILEEKSFAGIPYEKERTVTSFAQADEIVSSLKGLGVTNMNVGVVSWFGGGLRNDAVLSEPRIASGLGGKSALSDLTKEMDGFGKVGLGADLLKVYKGLPHFNNIFYATRFPNNSVAQGYEFNPAIYWADGRWDPYYFLSPRYLAGVMADYTASADQLGISSLWLEDVGNVLSSDFHSSGNVDREASKGLITQAVADAASGRSLTIQEPNAYLWTYLDTALSLPTESSGHMLIDESIPFLQMVLSGHVNYASKPFNRSGDLQTAFLEAVETGADIYYEWIYEPDDVIAELDGIEKEKVYSMSYEKWVGTAAAQYARMKEELSCVDGMEITGHCRIADGVYCTSYGDVRVVVNYNEDAVDYNGVTVGARDFALLR